MRVQATIGRTPYKLSIVTRNIKLGLQPLRDLRILAQVAPVPITSRSRRNLMEVAITALTLGVGVWVGRCSQIAGLHSKIPLLAELHKALQYDLLAHAPPAETFPLTTLNEIIKLHLTGSVLLYTDPLL